MNLRRNFLGACAGVALLALGSVSVAQAQIWDQYVLSIVPRIYQPQTNLGVQIERTEFTDAFARAVVDPDNGVAGPFDIFPGGLSFEYNGTEYSQYIVSVNGWISFELSGGFPEDGDPFLLFSNNRPNLTVAPFWGDHYYRDRRFPDSDLDPAGRPFTTAVIRRVAKTAPTGENVLVVEWENLNINYNFDPLDPTNSLSPNRRPQASSVGSFQVWLFEAPAASVSRQGDIEFHYGPVGPPAQQSGNAIVKTQGAGVGIEDEPAVPGGNTTFINAVAFAQTNGNQDSTRFSRRLTTNWPPTRFPGQAFLFSATRLLRRQSWGDGDAELTQLDFNVPQLIRDDQRRFVTFLDVIRILRHRATRNVPFDYGFGRHGYHGDVNHNGRFYYSTANYDFTGDSLDGAGNIVRYVVPFPTKSVNELDTVPQDNTFSGFLYDADEFDAGLIQTYLAAKLPVLPWLPDTLPHFTGKAVAGQASDVMMSKGATVGTNRIEIPVTVNSQNVGPFGLRIDVAPGTRIVEVRPMARTTEAWVEGIAGDNGAAISATGTLKPGDVVATLVVETDANGEAAFSNVRLNERNLGARKMTVNSAVAGSNLALASSPNPFTAGTTTMVSYAVPAEGSVSVRVFDALGRSVASLFEGTVAAGSYTTEWNGTTANGTPVAAGVYYCRVEQNGQTRTIPVTVR